MDNKYYLLTFNQDYADEHNVPALACFNQETYQQWLNLPLGQINKDYDQQLANYNNYNQAKKDISAQLEAIVPNWMRVSSPNEKLPKDLYDQYKNLHLTFGYKSTYIQKPKILKKCYLYASLGNGGECFDEDYMHYKNHQQLIDAGIVKVVEVAENFYTCFNNHGLSSLSLCNVFELERDNYDGYDEESDDEIDA